MRVRPMMAGVAAALLLPMGCTADDTDPAAATPQAPATAGPDSEHLVVNGTVTRGDSPVAGATMTLTLWPEDVSDVKVGEAVDTVDVAEATTDGDGRYVLTVDPAELSSRYFNGEVLNFEIYLSVDDQLALWSSPVWLVDEDYWRSDDRALVGDTVMDISYELDGPSILLTDSFGDTTTDELTMMDARPSAP